MNQEHQEIRPSFIPGEVDFDQLPSEVQLTLNSQIGPMYQELVLHAPTFLAASIGMSHVFLACLEVLEQYQLAQAEFSGLAQGANDPAERHNRREPYYRLHSAKSKSTNALLRLGEINKSAPPKNVGPQTEESA